VTVAVRPFVEIAAYAMPLENGYRQLEEPKIKWS
jgi:hypothetical protein